MDESSVKHAEFDHSTCEGVDQKYLVSEELKGLRFWDNVQPKNQTPFRTRDYEAFGYVIEGAAELQVGKKVLYLVSGDFWVVPQGVSHRYMILEAFTAVELNFPLAGKKDPGKSISSPSNGETSTNSEEYDSAESHCFSKVPPKWSRAFFEDFQLEKFFKQVCRIFRDR